MGCATPVRRLGGALLGVLGSPLSWESSRRDQVLTLGDSGAARNGLDSWLLQHFHAWPSYVVLGLIVTLVSLARFASVGSPWIPSGEHGFPGRHPCSNWGRPLPSQ